MKTKPEAAEFILEKPNISVEIYLFVLWTKRKSGRKLYAPENFRALSDPKVIIAKFHPSGEIRILIECHKTTEKFPIEDLNEVLEFFKYNCNAQNPTRKARYQFSYSTSNGPNRMWILGIAIKASSADDLVRYVAFIRNF